MLAARALIVRALSIRRRASFKMTAPAPVRIGVLPARSNKAIPNTPSSVLIAWLTADCTLPNRRAAAEKLPVSATAAKILI